MPASSSPNILPSINPIPTAAGASTTATSNSAVRLLQSFEISLRNVCDFFSSWFIDLRRLWDLVGSRYERARHGQLGWSDMVQLLALCSLIQGIRVWRKSAGKKGENEDLIRKRGSSLGFRGDRRLDAESTDPGLLKKHSTFKSYTTSFATYPSVRTFYRPHPQADKLPSVPTPLPLLVFIHGLGGSLAQFNPLLTSLVNVGPCLGIDLPGCGRSAFYPKSWEAYSITALVELLIVMIREHCAQHPAQGVILIGHSMGCSLSALLASTISSPQVLALIGTSPQSSPPPKDKVVLFQRLLRVPTPIFDIWRTWDRRGGPESASVARFVGKEADIEVKRLQERFNAQSRTAVWRRMAWGALPAFNGSTSAGGLPGLDVWGDLKIPLFLVGGEGDGITKTEEIVKIGRALGKDDRPRDSESNKADLFATDDTSDAIEAMEQQSPEEKRQSAASKTEMTVISDSPNPAHQVHIPSYSKTRRVLITSILPAPASHGLLYDPATYRTLAGLIQTFLYQHVDTRLSLGWQLQHLSTEGKWDVKNLAKWQAIQPVSEPIAGIFRAMKTLREIDDIHSPESFVRNWNGKIKAVIDISHESPVYDPKGLDEGGIEYHKLPTVSKIPPVPEEVQDFIKLVDRLRSSPPTDSTNSTESGRDDALIGVHCHYGFNRTGFFICCYLVEREGYGVQRAIDEFAKMRAPGIRHAHFLDQLFVRYCLGLRRADEGG